MVLTLQGVLAVELVEELGVARPQRGRGHRPEPGHLVLRDTVPFTHALIGGLVGVGMAFHGAAGVHWGAEELLQGQLAGVVKVPAFLGWPRCSGLRRLVSAHEGARLALRRATIGVNRQMRRVQWITTSVQTLAHGANDAQKQMALVALLLMAMGGTADVPLWVRTACAAAIALGTLGGGYRIMRTVGRKIFKIRPVHALVAQTNASLTVVFATALGAPVSSTQVVTAGVMGVGTAENRRLVHWRVGKDLVVSWFLTIPATALLAGSTALGLKWITGV